MTDVRAVQPHSLKASFASGIERRGQAAQNFVEEMQSVIARGEAPNPHRLVEGEALLQALDRDITASMHSVVMAASEVSDAVIDNLQTNLGHAEDAAQSLRNLLSMSAGTTPRPSSRA